MPKTKKRLRWTKSTNAIKVSEKEIDALAKQLIAARKQWYMARTGDTLVLAVNTEDGLDVYDCKIRRVGYVS